MTENYSLQHFYEWLQYSPSDRTDEDAALPLDAEIWLQGFCDEPVTFRGRVYGQAPIRVQSLSKNLSYGNDQAIINLANTRADLDALFDIRRRVSRGDHVNDKIRLIDYLPDTGLIHDYIFAIGSVTIAEEISVSLLNNVDAANNGVIPNLYTSQKHTPELPLAGQGINHY